MFKHSGYDALVQWVNDLKTTIFSNEKEKKAYNKHLKNLKEPPFCFVIFQENEKEIKARHASCWFFYDNWKFFVDQSKKEYQCFELHKEDQSLKKDLGTTSFANWDLQDTQTSLMEKLSMFKKTSSKQSNAMFLFIFVFILYQQQLKDKDEKEEEKEGKEQIQSFQSLSVKGTEEFHREKLREIERRLELWSGHLKKKKEKDFWIQKFETVCQEIDDLRSLNSCSVTTKMEFNEHEMIFLFELMLGFAKEKNLNLTILSHALMIQRMALSSFSLLAKEDKNYLHYKMVTDTCLFLTLSMFQRRPYASGVHHGPVDEKKHIVVKTSEFETYLFNTLQCISFHVPFCTSWNIIQLLISKQTKWSRTNQNVLNQVFLFSMLLQHIERVQISQQERSSNSLMALAAFSVCCHILQLKNKNQWMKDIQVHFSFSEIDKHASKLFSFIQLCLKKATSNNFSSKETHDYLLFFQVLSSFGNDSFLKCYMKQRENDLVYSFDENLKIQSISNRVSAGG